MEIASKSPDRAEPPVSPTDSVGVVTGLCSFADRYAGTDAERRAGNWLAGLLRAAGRETRLEPIHVHPGWLGVHAVLAAAGIAASLVGRSVPAAGFAIALSAATFLHLDLGGRPITPRRLLFRRVSQNIVAPGRSPAAPLRVVLCANYDAPRAVGAAAPGFARLASRAQAALGIPIGPFRLTFWAIALLLPILGARMAGLEGEWLSVLQIPSTVVLVVAAFCLTEAELSTVSPGANDNASGVAAALAAADALDERPSEGADVWLALLGGGSAPGESIRALLARHDDDLHRETVFICFDACGRGELRYQTSSGWTISYPADARAIAACERLVEAAGEDSGLAEPMANGNGDLAYTARIRGRRAIALGCRGPEGFAPGRRRMDDVPEEIQPAAIARSAGFAVALVRELASEARSVKPE